MISRDQLLLPCFLQADIVHDSAVVEDIPSEAGRDGSHKPPRLEQMAEIGRLYTYHAVDKNCRVEIRFRNTNPRTLRGHLALGATDIGSAAKQIGRNAHGHRVRNVRHWLCTKWSAGAKIWAEIMGRRSQQNT